MQRRAGCVPDVSRILSTAAIHTKARLQISEITLLRPVQSESVEGQRHDSAHTPAVVHTRSWFVSSVISLAPCFCFSVVCQDDCIYDWMIGKDGKTTAAPLGASALEASQVAAAAQTPLQRGVTQQQTSPYNSMLNTTGGAPATPTATAAQAAATNNYLAQYNLMTQQYGAQLQQQAAAQAQAQAAAVQAAAAQQRVYQMPPATPRPPVIILPPTPDPTIELRARIRTLEQSLESQRTLAADWKMHYDKAAATIAAQKKEIAALRAIQPASPKATDANVIPLASAASLKRRRTTAIPASTDSAGDPIYLDEDGVAVDSNKKARKKT